MYKTSEHKRLQVKTYQMANSAVVQARNAAYRLAHAEELRVKKRAYYLANKEKINLKSKLWADANRDKIRLYVSACNKKHRASRRVYAKTYRQERIASDPDYRAQQVVRARLRKALRVAGVRKTLRTCALVGCSAYELRKHLEGKFEAGMSWDNHGLHGWHVDHIVSVASFDLSDVEQQRKCFHFTNLQPLWAKDNWKKGY
jgi:hypothetical protein